MITLRLYIGLNDKDARRQLISFKKACKIIVETVGDCTIQKAAGHYTHEDGKPTQERTLVVTKFIAEQTPKENVDRLGARLCYLLNQECVGVEVIHNVDVYLV